MEASPFGLTAEVFRLFVLAGKRDGKQQTIICQQKTVNEKRVYGWRLTWAGCFKYYPTIGDMGSEAERIFQDVTVGDLDEIRLFVRETSAACGCETAAIEELIVAVNEATANIVRHGYQNEPGEIRVTVVCSDNMVKVTLLDNCAGFDPTTIPSPDTTLPLAERPFGGLGVHMMRTFCDELSYRSGSRGGNELILVKRIAR